MDDREADAAARLEDAGDLADGAGQVVDVLERHERDDHVRRAVVERERRGVGQPVVAAASRSLAAASIVGDASKAMTR